MKKLFAFISPLFGFLILATPSFAQDKVDLCPSTGQFSKLCNFATSDFGTVLGQLLTLVFVVSIVAALFYLVWGGFKWLTSGGDKTAVGAAREHIVAAIVGLVVIFLSYFILNIMVNFFTGHPLSELEIPTLGTSSSTTPKCSNAGGACKGNSGKTCCAGKGLTCDTTSNPNRTGSGVCKKTSDNRL